MQFTVVRMSSSTCLMGPVYGAASWGRVKGESESEGWGV